MMLGRQGSTHSECVISLAVRMMMKDACRNCLFEVYLLIPPLVTNLEPKVGSSLESSKLAIEGTTNGS